ncbi:Zn-ribbon domain-containing OB-fold protein [Halopelagius fulvigenes]|uniref:Zn-ribbon domain-containing OB-fold protein n=1 Tax=Halopelagius fulvigenes TaxID=1198324 RepID=A0ABD5U5F5_9EURY
MTDSGFDEWIAALGATEGFYLACPEGHGSLPPRRTCPHCGATDLREEPLPEEGTVETYTEVHVAGPDFAGLTPYVTAIASFGPVRLTGAFGGLSDDPPDPSVGRRVYADAEENPNTGESVVVLRPV